MKGLAAAADEEAAAADGEVVAADEEAAAADGEAGVVLCEGILLMKGSSSRRLNSTKSSTVEESGPLT